MMSLICSGVTPVLSVVTGAIKSRSKVGEGCATLGRVPADVKEGHLSAWEKAGARHLELRLEATYLSPHGRLLLL